MEKKGTTTLANKKTATTIMHNIRTLFLSRNTVIAEIFVHVKVSYSSVHERSYAINFHTARTMSHTLLNVHGFRMLLNFVLPAKSTKSTKLNRVRKFLRLQYRKIGTVARLVGTSRTAAPAIKLDFSTSHYRNSVLILCIIVVALFFGQGRVEPRIRVHLTLRGSKIA